MWRGEPAATFDQPLIGLRAPRRRQAAAVQGAARGDLHSGGTMIKKVKEGYKVLSEKSGKNLGGPYKTKAQAKKRLQQVEFFKRTKG
jgi:hypothetical protein